VRTAAAVQDVEAGIHRSCGRSALSSPRPAASIMAGYSDRAATSSSSRSRSSTSLMSWSESSDHWSTRGSSCSAFKVASWGSQPEMFSTQIAHPGAPMCRSRTLIARARKQRCQFNRSPGPRSVLVNSCTARGCRFFTRCPPDRAANTRTDKQKPPRRPGEQ
jgi:hypothetical protein